MNWQGLIEALNKKEKNTMESLVHERDEKAIIELQMKVKIYREEKRVIESMVKKGEH